jgi:hypothetical protein
MECLRHVSMFGHKASFYGEELAVPCLTPKLEGHPVSAVRDCLFNIFAATFHIGGRSSIRKLRARHSFCCSCELVRLLEMCSSVGGRASVWQVAVGDA